MNSIGPLAFPVAVRAAMARRDVVGTGVELLEAKMGFRAMLTLNKQPIGSMTPRGALDATADPALFREWSYCWPDSELAIVLGHAYAVVDVDTEDASPTAFDVPDSTWGEKTRRGHHWLVRLPLDRSARRAKLPNGHGDFITGDGAFVVMAPSADRWPLDIDAPILTLPTVSLLWEHITPRPPSHVYVGRMLSSHRNEADRVLGQLRAGKYGNDIADLFTGRWRRTHPEWSESERDFRLLDGATYFNRDPQVLAALLVGTGWVSDSRANPKADPGAYVVRTVANALAVRDRREAARLDSIRDRIAAGRLLLKTELRVSVRQTVLDVTGEKKDDITAVIIEFAAVDMIDAFRGDDGWVRLPVCDLSEMYGVHRQTVWRKLCRLNECGTIERRVVNRLSDKCHRKDSWIRLPKGGVSRVDGA